MSFVDILEGIKLLGQLVLYNPNLLRRLSEQEQGRVYRVRGNSRKTHPAKSTLAYDAKEDKVKEIDLSIEVDWLESEIN